MTYTTLEQLKQAANDITEPYKWLVAEINGHIVKVRLIEGVRTSSSHKGWLRWKVDGKSVAKANLEKAIAS